MPDDEIKSCCILIIPYVGVVAKPYCYSKSVSLMKLGLRVNERTFPSEKEGEKINKKTYTKAGGDFFKV